MSRGGLILFVVPNGFAGAPGINNDGRVGRKRLLALIPCYKQLSGGKKEETLSQVFRGYRPG